MKAVTKLMGDVMYVLSRSVHPLVLTKFKRKEKQKKCIYLFIFIYFFIFPTYVCMYILSNYTLYLFEPMGFFKKHRLVNMKKKKKKEQKKEKKEKKILHKVYVSVCFV